MKITRRQALLGTAAATLAPQALRAQAYPARPIRVIVPFGPGGLADVTIRVVGEKLGQRIGQSIVVVNQPGPGGVSAARAVIGSDPDGYTLGLLTNGTAVSAALISSLGFDPMKDFRPVSALGFFDFVIAAGAGSPHADLRALIAHARANAGKLNIGTIAVGSTQHLTAVLLQASAGIEAQIVTFRTTPDLVNATIRGDVDCLIDGYVATGKLIESGQLKALATTGPERSPVLPKVATVAESGVAGFDVTSWNALFAPAGAPDSVVEKLNSEIKAVLADEQVRSRLLELGIEARASTPAAIGDRLKADIEKWGAVIAKAGIPRQ